MKSDLQVGSLIYDTRFKDYGVIIACDWTNNISSNYKYYLIHWQNTEQFNINKDHNYRWSATYLYDRINTGDIVVYEKK